MRPGGGRPSDQKGQGVRHPEALSIKEGEITSWMKRKSPDSADYLYICCIIFGIDRLYCTFCCGR